jgi:hypothetical protein
MLIGMHSVGRGGSVGITTLYGMDGPGFGSREGAKFSAPVQIRPGAYPGSYTMGTGSFLEVKRRRALKHPPLSSAEVKERLESFLYFISVPS